MCESEIYKFTDGDRAGEEKKKQYGIEMYLQKSVKI